MDKGYVFACEAGLQTTRENTRYGKQGDYKTPMQICYAKIEYAQDAYGHPLFEPNGERKIKSKKWEPFLHAVPLIGEKIDGLIGNSRAFYYDLTSPPWAQPANVGETMSASPYADYTTQGFDYDLICNNVGTAEIAFRRSSDTVSTIRHHKFKFWLIMGNKDDGLLKIEETDFIEPGQAFKIPLIRQSFHLDYVKLVWVEAKDGNGAVVTNTGWEVPMDAAYSITLKS